MRADLGQLPGARGQRLDAATHQAHVDVEHGVVGLQLGEIVYDGPPTGLTAEVLTRIYGEEDWSATIRKVDEDADAAAEPPIKIFTPDRNQPHRDRMAGLT